MKIPVWILSAVLGTLLGLQIWALHEIVRLEINITAIETKLDMQPIAQYEIH